VFERGVQSTVRRWRFQPIANPQTVRRTFTFAN
jgi:outer membrane biosynthesis protein TonB